MIRRRGIALMLVNFADPLGPGIAAHGPGYAAFLEKTDFTEGGDVKAGQTLFSALRRAALHPAASMPG
jgi:hypothetical protein